MAKEKVFAAATLARDFEEFLAICDFVEEQGYGVDEVIASELGL